MEKIITLLDYKKELEQVKNYLFETAEIMGHEPQIILHWTAGRYRQIFTDYHISIDNSGILHKTNNLDYLVSATYLHNSGTIAVALNCCLGATPKNLGDYPPTRYQIETMSRLIAIFADVMGVEIDKYHVLTHGEVADNEDGPKYSPYFYEPYGPKTTCERWDLEFLGTSESPIFNPFDETGKRGGDVLRGKAIWYLNNGNII